MLNKDELILNGRYDNPIRYVNIESIYQIDNYIDKWKQRDSLNVGLLILVDVFREMFPDESMPYSINSYIENNISEYFISKDVIVDIIKITDRRIEIRYRKLISI